MRRGRPRGIPPPHSNNSQPQQQTGSYGPAASVTSQLSSSPSLRQSDLPPMLPARAVGPRPNLQPSLQPPAGLSGFFSSRSTFLSSASSEHAQQIDAGTSVDAASSTTERTSWSSMPVTKDRMTNPTGFLKTKQQWLGLDASPSKEQVALVGHEGRSHSRPLGWILLIRLLKHA